MSNDLYSLSSAPDAKTETPRRRPCRACRPGSEKCNHRRRAVAWCHALQAARARAGLLEPTDLSCAAVLLRFQQGRPRLEASRERARGAATQGHTGVACSARLPCSCAVGFGFGLEHSYRCVTTEMTYFYLLMSIQTNMPMGIYSTKDKAIQAGWKYQPDPPAWCVARFTCDNAPRTDDMLSENVYEPDESSR